jgi:hypothetical protein
MAGLAAEAGKTEEAAQALVLKGLNDPFDANLHNRVRLQDVRGTHPCTEGAAAVRD